MLPGWLEEKCLFACYEDKIKEWLADHANFFSLALLSSFQI